MRRALLPILWAVLLLPSANFARFDGLPLDTGPELIGLLLLLPLTVSAALRRYAWGLTGARSRMAATLLLVLGLAAIGGKFTLWASGDYEGFLGCYRYALAPPPVGPCERVFTNPWFRHQITRVDPVIDFGPQTWNLGFLNSARFIFTGLQPEGAPWRERLPLEVSWWGTVEGAKPWVARVSYVGEVTLRIGQPASNGSVAETQLPPRYGEIASADVQIPAGRQLVSVVYRFDDGARRPGPEPAGPWATIQLARVGESSRLATRAVSAVPPAARSRLLATGVDAIVVILGVAIACAYFVLLRRDWWLAALVAVAGVGVSQFQPRESGLPVAFGLFVTLLGLAAASLARPWRRRLLLAFLGAAYLTFCLVLSSSVPLDMALQRPPTDALIYESQARSILETWSLEGGEAYFRYQPGFRYWRFLERLLLGDGDPFVMIVALTSLAWGLLWAIARFWPRPAPPRRRRLAYLLGVGLLLGLATSTPVVAFVEAPLSEYPTWILLPLILALLLTARTGWQWGLAGFLGGVAMLCRLNQILAIGGYLVAFGWRRWPISPRPVMLGIGLALAMLALPPLHNRYYGGVDTPALRIMNVNRAALAISPSRLAGFHRDPQVRRDLWDQVGGILYTHEIREVTAEQGSYTRRVVRGLQWLWLGTVVVVLPRRGVPGVTKALLLVPLLYLIVYAFYDVDIYYPRHLVAGYLGLGISALYAVGRGWGSVPKP